MRIILNLLPVYSRRVEAVETEAHGFASLHVRTVAQKSDKSFTGNFAIGIVAQN